MYFNLSLSLVMFRQFCKQRANKEYIFIFIKIYLNICKNLNAKLTFYLKQGTTYIEIKQSKPNESSNYVYHEKFTIFALFAKVSRMSNETEPGICSLDMHRTKIRKE